MGSAGLARPLLWESATMPMIVSTPPTFVPVPDVLPYGVFVGPVFPGEGFVDESTLGAPALSFSVKSRPRRTGILNRLR
jgi:hypothetical protein